MNSASVQRSDGSIRRAASLVENVFVDEVVALGASRVRVDFLIVGAT